MKSLYLFPSDEFMAGIRRIEEKYRYKLSEPVLRVVGGLLVSKLSESGNKTKSSIDEKARKLIIGQGKVDLKLYEINDILRFTKSVTESEGGHDKTPEVAKWFKQNTRHSSGEIARRPQGYRACHFETNECGLIGGAHVEIRDQSFANNLTHSLYKIFSDPATSDSDKKTLKLIMKEINDLADDKSLEKNAGAIWREINKMPKEDGGLKPNLKKIPKIYLNELKDPPGRIKNNAIGINEKRMKYQIQVAEDMGKELQPKFLKLGKEMADDVYR